MSFKPAIMTGVFPELRPEEAVKRLVDIGWRAFELYSVHMKEMDGREDPAENFSSLKELCDKLGAHIFTAHDNTQGVTSERFIRWAQILGVKRVVLHPLVDETKEENLEKLKKWSALAERFEIRLAVENMHDMIRDREARRAFGSVPSELLWLIEQTNPEFVGVCWDVNHAYAQKLDQYRSIKELGKHLVHVHVTDTTTDSEEQHLLPFEGKVNWKAVIKALREIGYDGLFCLEPGTSINALPLSMRDLKIGYALELLESMIEKL